MDTLRDKLEQVAGGSRIDAIMHIIENHIEWTDPDDCEFGHVFTEGYEITNGFTLYDDDGRFISDNKTLDAAKQAAQAHKDATT